MFTARVFRMGRHGEKESFAELIAETREQAQDFVSTVTQRADEGVVIGSSITPWKGAPHGLIKQTPNEMGDDPYGVEAEFVPRDAGETSSVRRNAGTKTPPRDAERSAGGDDGSWFSS